MYACSPKKTTTGLPSALAASIATSSAGLSAARCARCIQYTTQRPSGSGAPGRRTRIRGSRSGASNMIAQHKFLGMRLQVDLIEQIAHILPAGMVRNQRERHDERNESATVVGNRGRQLAARAVIGVIEISG